VNALSLGLTEEIHGDKVREAGRGQKPMSPDVSCEVRGLRKRRDPSLVRSSYWVQPSSVESGGIRKDLAVWRTVRRDRERKDWVISPEIEIRQEHRECICADAKHGDNR
jgi:hypothetical protein